MSKNSNGPEIGDSYTFEPEAFTDKTSSSNIPTPVNPHPKVTGRVIQIHREHRWFRVEYDGGRSGVLHECFKF